MTLLARLAEAEWHQRLAFAQKMRRDRRWSAEEANARLMPWLAIALSCGAEPPEAAPLLEDIRRHDPHGRTHARAIAAAQVCVPAEMRAELARARDAAVQAAIARPSDRSACERSQRLQHLAVYLGVPMPAVNDHLQEAA